MEQMRIYEMKGKKKQKEIKNKNKNNDAHLKYSQTITSCEKKKKGRTFLRVVSLKKESVAFEEGNEGEEMVLSFGKGETFLK